MKFFLWLNIATKHLLVTKGPLADFASNNQINTDSISNLKCPKCNFDLRMHLWHETCPECGHSLNLDYWEKQVARERAYVKYIRRGCLYLLFLGLVTVIAIPLLYSLLELCSPQYTRQYQTYSFNQDKNNVFEKYTYTIITSEKFISPWSKPPDDFKLFSIKINSRPRSNWIIENMVNFYFEPSIFDPNMAMVSHGFSYEGQNPLYVIDERLPLDGLDDQQKTLIAMNGIIKNDFGNPVYTNQLSKEQFDELLSVAKVQNSLAPPTLTNLTLADSNYDISRARHIGQRYVFWAILILLYISTSILYLRIKAKMPRVFRNRRSLYLAVVLGITWVSAIAYFNFDDFDQFYCDDYLTVLKWKFKRLF